MRILSPFTQEEFIAALKSINVDGYGIKLMAPKAAHLIIRLDRVSNITANILKQEMLSLGGDAAVSRDSLTGRKKYTDCLLMGTLMQYNRLIEKLKIQPFGLNELGVELGVSIARFNRSAQSVLIGTKKIELCRRTLVMGIVNATDDSFSGDGIYQSGRAYDTGKGVEIATRMCQEGADIIDLGGESSRPFSKPVSTAEEIKRVIPLIKALAKKIKAPLSVDTYKPDVAERALGAGAKIINDISGLRDKRMLKVLKKHKPTVVIMHMRGTPQTMQKNPRYVSLIDDIINSLETGIENALEQGLGRDQVIIDPGIGFGKNPEDNLEILKHLSEFKILGAPILVGPSRKSFIGKILGVPARERAAGTLAACVIASLNGASIVRVHDVKPAVEALKIANAIRFN